MSLRIILWIKLLCFVIPAFAQQEVDEKAKDDNTARPSWSVGLPERQARNKSLQQSFKKDLSLELEIDMSSFMLKSKPKASINLDDSVENIFYDINPNEESVPIDEPKQLKAILPEQADDVLLEADQPVDSPSTENFDTLKQVDDVSLGTDLPIDSPSIESVADDMPGEQINFVTNPEADNDIINDVVVDDESLASVENSILLEQVDDVLLEADQSVNFPPIESVADDISSGQINLVKNPEIDNDIINNNVDESLVSVENSIAENTNDEILRETPVTDQKEIALLTKDEINGANIINNGSFGDGDINKEITQNSYQWKALKRAEIEYPIKAARYNLSGWLEINITISPDGFVTNAHVERRSRQGKVFVKNALKAINSWEFDPPLEYGINMNISRVFTIEFER